MIRATSRGMTMNTKQGTHRIHIASLALIAVVLASFLGSHTTPARAAMAISINQPFTGVSAPGWTLLGDAVLTGGDTDAIGQGWLQLTNNGYFKAGSVIYDTPISSDKGIQISFQYATHESLPNATVGADGFSFYLIDGATTNPTSGPPGGALGYSADSIDGRKGVTNGYVGIGFDEFGNFTTSRFGGCTITCTLNSMPQTVAIRGPGTDMTGYNLLKYVQLSALNPPRRIDGMTRSNPRSIRITFLDLKISVDIDFGNGFESIISAFDLKAAGMPDPPATFKMGLSGSTGGITNFHEIRNLTVGGAMTSATTLDTPTSALGTSITTSTTGQPVTFTATVTPNQPSGNVTFLDGVTVIGVGTLDATTHKATFTTSALANGIHSITAYYEGDNIYGASTSAPVPLEVISTNADLSNLLVDAATLIPPFAASNDAYVVNVINDITRITFTPSVADPNATLTVNNAPATSGTPVTRSNLQVGANLIPITVTAPDKQTTHTYNLTVNRLPIEGNQASITSLGSSTTTSVTGKPVTFTASVTFGAGARVGQPSGTVTFLDGGTAIGVGTLIANQAIFTTTSLLKGIHSITARYEGDTIYGVSTSAPVSLTVLSTNADLSDLLVNPGMLSPAFATNNNDYTVAVAYKNMSISLTPSVADSSATLKVNGTSVTPGSPVTSDLQVGANLIPITVTAQDGVTTHTYTVTVNRLSLGGEQTSATSLGASPNSLFTGQTATFTATVTFVDSNAPIDQPPPSGTVAFLDGETVIGVRALIANQAIFTTTLLVKGVRSITARYEGDKTYAVSTSEPVSLTVISTNANLGSLQMSVGTLSPAFAAGTYVYTMSVPYTVTNVVMTPSTADNSATLKVNGTLTTSGSPMTFSNLQVGANLITITVTAQDGVTTHTYRVTVNRLSLGNNQVSATSLGSSPTSLLTGQTATFTSTVTFDPSAPIDQPQPSGTVAFLDGETVIGIRPLIANQAIFTTTSLLKGIHSITARYEGDTTYAASTSTPISLTVISTNANLGSLQISMGVLSPAFAADTYIYTVSVPYTVTSFIITPSTADSFARLNVNGIPAISGFPVTSDLQVGANQITITVTSQDGGTTHTYSITVNRNPSEYTVYLPILLVS